MKYYRFNLSTGGFAYAREHADGSAPAEYFDEHLGEWVPSETLDLEILNDGSWMSCTEAQALAATRRTVAV